MKGIAHIVYPLPQQHLKRKSLLESLFSKKSKYLKPEELVWPNPTNAPLSITKAIINSLKKHYKIRLYDLFDTFTDIKLGKDDIFIGHPWPDFTTKSETDNSWTTFDKLQITNRMVLKYPFDPRVFLLSPFNISFKQIGWAIPIFENCKNYIAISGEIWSENLTDIYPVFNICKFHRLDMAIERNDYPLLKKEFNPEGKRKFFYYGRVSDEKNTRLLTLLAQKCPNFHCGYIGDEEIDGCTRISGASNLNPQFVAKHLLDYDFFISPSKMDAQVTTVLETMSWGFGIACTKESGYEHPSIFSLSVDDIEENCKTIELIQKLTTEEIIKKQRENYDLLKTKFNWCTFEEKLLKIIINE